MTVEEAVKRVTFESPAARTGPPHQHQPKTSGLAACLMADITYDDDGINERNEYLITQVCATQAAGLRF